MNASRQTRPAAVLSPLVWALLLLCPVPGGCSGGESDTAAASAAADAAEVGIGGAMIQPIAPPEAGDLWPMDDGWRVRITRQAAGGADELAATLDGPHDGAIRVLPFAGQPTTFRLELRDASGVLRAQASTASAIYDQTEPDRQVVAFLLPPDGVVSAVDAAGVPLGLPGLLGSSATTMATGDVLFVGGAQYAGGAPCAPGAAGSPTDLIWRYDPADGGLTAFAKLNTARSFHVAAALSPVVLAVLGGQTQATAAGSAATAGVELIRTDVGTTQAAVQPLSIARARACGVSIGGRLIVAGGLGPAGASAELWDPAIGSVGKPIVLSPPRYDAACVSARDPANDRDLVFIVGGRSATGAIAEVLPVAVEDGGLVPFLPIPLPAGPLHQAFVHVPHQTFTLVVAGGFAGPDGASPSAKAWINLFGATSSANWQPLAGLSAARGCAAAAVVDGGARALLLGGMAASGEPLAAIDQLLFGGGAGPALAVALPQPRAAAVAVTLRDGTVLLAGGVALVDGVAKVVDGALRFAPAPLATR